MVGLRKAAAGLLTVCFIVGMSCVPSYAEDEPWAVPQKYVTKYATDRVNLRSGPHTDKDVLKIINRGESVDFIAIYNYEWSAVVYNGTKGFVKSEFLSNEKPPEPKVELMYWADVKAILKVGVSIPVYDVLTGATYYVKSFSNGMHADVEPVTPEDTAIMKHTYNGRWEWDGRPVWVTIDGHTIAAAINGMPHGGGVNDTNGMDGQVCLHFKGSAVHNGNMVYSQQMQDVVMQAYNMQ